MISDLALIKKRIFYTIFLQFLDVTFALRIWVVFLGSYPIPTITTWQPIIPKKKCYVGYPGLDWAWCDITLNCIIHCVQGWREAIKSYFAFLMASRGKFWAVPNTIWQQLKTKGKKSWQVVKSSSSIGFLGTAMDHVTINIVT